MVRNKNELSPIILGLIALSSIAAITILNSWPIFSGDFSIWRTDFAQFLLCIHGQDDACTEISRFPFAYTLNASILSGALSVAGERWRIVVLNYTFLALPLFIFTFRANASLARASTRYLAAIILTPLIPAYVLSGLIEPQSGVTLGLFFTSVYVLNTETDPQRRRLLLVVAMLSGFMQPLYKDTNGFLLAVVYGSIFFLNLMSQRVTYFSHFKSFPLMPVQAGCAVCFGQLVEIGFNWTRYKTIVPLEYVTLSRDALVDAYHSIIFLIFSIVSPNGGILIFWTLAFFVSVHLMRPSGHFINQRALLAPILFLAFQLILLSRWWSPFG